jgi:mannose-6-phosphate isomerase-like protein (cupin superfamily)
MDDGDCAAAALALGADDTLPEDAAAPAEVDAWRARFGALLLRLDTGGTRPAPEAVWQRIEAAIGPQRVRQKSAWLPVISGIDLKYLWVDPPSGQRAALMRLQPGTVLPEHLHSETEECLVLEGEVEMGGRLYGMHDYIHAPAGTTHPPISCANGALVFLRWGP